MKPMVVTLDLKKELRKKDKKIKELEKLVSTDALTWILNRRGFSELVRRFIDEVKFQKENPDRRKRFVVNSLSLLFFDIDNFKKINDTHGHKVGDQILKYVSSVISEKLRTSDFVGRWGGEEIVVALVGAQEENAYRKGEEIRKTIKSRVKIPTLKDLKVTVSVGVAELQSGESLEDVVKRADQAMYKAKTEGKDKVVKSSRT